MGEDWERFFVDSEIMAQSLSFYFIKAIDLIQVPGAGVEPARC